MIACRAVKLWAPKSEERASAYEDAAAYRCARGRFAVSDGVTQSIYAGLWARLITHSFVRGPRPTGAALADILEPARSRWQDYATERLAGLPWFAQIKARQGGHATFLSLTLHGRGGDGGSGTWQAVAVGDTCLFHLRGNAIQTAFPLGEAGQFNSFPAQLATDAGKLTDACSRALQSGGEWLAGDAFWLMTDALALWLIEQASAGRSAALAALAGVIAAPRPLLAFRRFVAAERRAGRLHDDDTTLLAVLTGG